MTNLIQKAILKVLKAHEGQVRKGDGQTPFVLHPLEVGITFAYYTTNETLITCAILHDVIESGKVRYEELKEEFSETIADIVKDLTEDKSIKDWAERKNESLNRLRNSPIKAGNFSAAYHIKAIDALVNMKELLTAIQSQGEAVWSKFNAPKEMKIQYFEVILKDLKQELPNNLIEQYVSALKDLQYAHLLTGDKSLIGFKDESEK